jgi:hypothetical protein
MKFHYSDGGRAEAGYKGKTGDCLCRAISIAVNMRYEDAYELINMNVGHERRSKSSSARTGVYGDTARRILDLLGWEWHPTMQIGSGCKVHLRDGELPMGRLIVRTSKHFCAVVDGTIYDTHNPSRGGTRCVYGYWSQP